MTQAQRTKLARLIAAILAVVFAIVAIASLSILVSKVIRSTETTTAICTSNVYTSRPSTSSERRRDSITVTRSGLSYEFTDKAGVTHYVSPDWSISGRLNVNDEITLHYNPDMPEKYWYTTITLVTHSLVILGSLIASALCVILAKYAESV